MTTTHCRRFAPLLLLLSGCAPLPPGPPRFSELNRFFDLRGFGGPRVADTWGSLIVLGLVLGVAYLLLRRSSDPAANARDAQRAPIFGPSVTGWQTGAAPRLRALRAQAHEHPEARTYLDTQLLDAWEALSAGDELTFERSAARAEAVLATHLPPRPTR